MPLSNNFTTSGGKLVITASGSGFRDTTREGRIGIIVSIQDFEGGEYLAKRAFGYTNERNSHEVFVSQQFILEGLPAGMYNVELEAIKDTACGSTSEQPSDLCTATDGYDRFDVTVVELPD